MDDNSESTKHTTESVISPEMNYRAGSSFELSPSDSSDGTYMWDEEGLEPIGSVHPCGSYESSEMNSIVCIYVHNLHNYNVLSLLLIKCILKTECMCSLDSCFLFPV